MQLVVQFEKIKQKHLDSRIEKVLLNNVSAMSAFSYDCGKIKTPMDFDFNETLLVCQCEILVLARSNCVII